LSQQSASQKSNQRIINRGLGVISGPWSGSFDQNAEGVAQMNKVAHWQTDRASGSNIMESIRDFQKNSSMESRCSLPNEYFAFAVRFWPRHCEDIASDLDSHDVFSNSDQDIIISQSQLFASNTHKQPEWPPAITDPVCTIWNFWGTNDRMIRLSKTVRSVWHAKSRGGNNDMGKCAFLEKTHEIMTCNFDFWFGSRDLSSSKIQRHMIVSAELSSTKHARAIPWSSSWDCDCLIKTGLGPEICVRCRKLTFWIQGEKWLLGTERESPVSRAIDLPESFW
jgi:hypothetical protein